MAYVRFIVIGEGTLERDLVEHLERLLIWVGGSEVSGISPDLGRLSPPPNGLAERIARAVELEPGANLIFVHRDTDGPSDEDRRGEILEAYELSEVDVSIVPVVPIQETEAWLLTNEDAIRKAAGKPLGSANLDIPSVAAIETTTSPKEVLEKALIDASETSGRARDRFKRRIGALKAQLLRRLPIDGDVGELSAWQKLREESKDAVKYF